MADMPGTGGGYYGGGGGGKRKGWLAPKYVLQLLPGEAVLQVRAALAQRGVCSDFLLGEAQLQLQSASLLQGLRPEGWGRGGVVAHQKCC